jgi:hypothetical protein
VPQCIAVYITQCTISCITPNISHPPCCKLAQVVALCSPPFNVKLSVPLPSSCNAALLIAKATTQCKEVAFRQPITRYHMLCCYRVNRPGLLNEQLLREIVQVDREICQLCQTWWQILSDIQHLTFSSVLKIYTYLVLSQFPKRKSCFSKGCTKGHWSINSEILALAGPVNCWNC